MSKFKSIIKKVKTTIGVGLEPFEQGKNNFEFPTPCIEKKAIERLAICKDCEFFQDEPIKEFRVTDKNIPEFSGKYCDDCGCTLSYKSRQNIEICEKWAE